MQEQRKSLLKISFELFASVEKIRCKIGADDCLYANGEKVLPQ